MSGACSWPAGCVRPSSACDPLDLLGSVLRADVIVATAALDDALRAALAESLPRARIPRRFVVRMMDR